MKNIEKHVNIILELLDQPLTKEDILENLAILEDLKLNFNQYHLYIGAVSAFITYLFHKNLIDYSIEDGKLYYFKNYKNLNFSQIKFNSFYLIVSKIHTK